MGSSALSAVWTDAAAVADRIADTSGLPLTPNVDGRLRNRLRHTSVTLKHVHA
ncbi:hypothetical protein [Nocardia acidivorans]|uniref:hypothetical protein n=1 Tax=Nocardia acidivorans TaxID=404580 RepID=UPI000ABB2E4C|nr:hypothetical protein [Nocardia acidivorans]